MNTNGGGFPNKYKSRGTALPRPYPPSRKPPRQRTQNRRKPWLRLLKFVPWLAMLGPLFMLSKGLTVPQMERLMSERTGARPSVSAPTSSKPAPSPPESTLAAEPSAPTESIASAETTAPVADAAPFQNMVPFTEPTLPPRTPQGAKLDLSPSSNGNFYARGEINGQPVLFVVDTGASAVSVPERLQSQLRLSRGRYMQTTTANGFIGMYETHIKSLTLGPLRLNNVLAVLNPGAPDNTVLLGMTALREVHMTQHGGRMTLQQEVVPEGVQESFAPQPALKIKKPVKECMGANKVINERVLKCVQGLDQEAGQNN